MANNRIYFANHAVGIGKDGVASYTAVHGLQRAGLTTNFNIENIQEIGQLAVYEGIEDIPTVELTMQKVIDGYPLLYHLCTRGATSDSLASRSATKCGVAISIFGDVQDSASGTPVAEMNASGCFVNSVRYEIPVEGNATEDVTLTGNHVTWKTTGFTFNGSLFDNTDVPLALSSGLGGIQRRENIIFAGTELSDVTRLPQGVSGIPGISSSGTNNKTNDVYAAHIQRITISTDLNREELRELGRKSPYFRAVTFPVEVICEIEVLSTDGNKVSATEEGAAGNGSNLNSHIIQVVLQDSTKLDLGSANKLRSVAFGNANATGGNAADTYTYVNNNILIVSHDQSPG